jgi:hypothetical protein
VVLLTAFLSVASVQLPLDQGGRVAELGQQSQDPGGVGPAGGPGVLLDELTQVCHERAPVLRGQLAAGGNRYAIEVVADQLLRRRVHGPIIHLLPRLVEPARWKNPG